jgi:serine/threonine-protein kinase HipA
MGQAEIVLQIKDLALSARAIEERKATTLDIRRLRGVGAAMGGARPKATVAGPNGSLFIAKFGCRGEALATEKMEVVVQRLAAKVGINACEASILTNKDFDPVALIRRFDRTPEGKRIPYISARTMLDAESGIGGTYTEIAYAIREHGHDTPRQLHELFRRIAFTILVSNVDDHLMNHGFIHVGGGKWKLSPMFDVNPAPDRVSTLKTPISETSGNEASVEALLDVSKEFDLEAKNAATIIAEMAASISAQWKPMATILGMTATEVRGYNDAFEHEEGRKALTLAGPKVAVRKTAPPGPGDVELP